MKRSVYRVLLGLHPQRFRERFGEEMLCIFDESPPERDTRLFADCLFSLLRQRLLRSNLWKMASGAVISSLLLGAWGNSTARGVDLSLARGGRWHDRLAMNLWLGERKTPLDKAEFEREAAQAVAIIAGIRKMEAQKRHAQPRNAPRYTPNPSSSTLVNKG